MTIKFTIPGQPVAKARGRFVPIKICRKCGKKTSRRICQCGNEQLGFLTSIATTEKATRVYENLVALCGQKARSDAKLDGLLSTAIVLRVTAYLSIPVSRAKKLKEGDPHLQKPDGDNILKSVKDGLTKVLWIDDSLVWDARVRKVWGNVPRAEVEVETL